MYLNTLPSAVLLAVLANKVSAGDYAQPQGYAAPQGYDYAGGCTATVYAVQTQCAVQKIYAADTCAYQGSTCEPAPVYYAANNSTGGYCGATVTVASVVTGYATQIETLPTGYVHSTSVPDYYPPCHETATAYVTQCQAVGVYATQLAYGQSEGSVNDGCGVCAGGPANYYMAPQPGTEKYCQSQTVTSYVTNHYTTVIHEGSYYTTPPHPTNTVTLVACPSTTAYSTLTVTNSNYDWALGAPPTGYTTLAPAPAPYQTGYYGSGSGSGSGSGYENGNNGGAVSYGNGGNGYESVCPSYTGTVMTTTYIKPSTTPVATTPVPTAPSGYITKTVYVTVGCSGTPSTNTCDVGYGKPLPYGCTAVPSSYPGTATGTYPAGTPTGPAGTPTGPANYPTGPAGVATSCPAQVAHPCPSVGYGQPMPSGCYGVPVPSKPTAVPTPSAYTPPGNNGGYNNNTGGYPSGYPVPPANSGASYNVRPHGFVLTIMAIALPVMWFILS